MAHAGLALAGLLLRFANTPSQAQTTVSLMPITQSWRYSTNNLDGVNWFAAGYAETGWSNLSPALLYIETAALPATKSTPLPERSGGGPMPTYYFRTTFNVTNPAVVTSLTFSNLIDDGAIFYLNGVEVQRVGIDYTNLTYTSFAGRSVGDATAFDLFTLAGDALTNLTAGANVLAAEVHQVNATSSDIVFGTALFAGTGLNLTRGPYLQNGSHTNVTVRWRTDVGVIGRVRCGTNLAGLNLSADDPGVTNEHQVRLTGLLPDTKYFYSIGTTNATLAGGEASYFFVTAPRPGTDKPTRIWVIGDSGTGNANQINVRNAYQTFTGARHTDLWLMLGDNAYSSGTDGEYQSTLFNVYTNLLRKSVVWPTPGNHDTAQATGLSDAYPYFANFTLPKNGEAGGFASGTEHYYAFDYGKLHFISLDSMTAIFRATNSAMYIWLTNDLANTTADWTVVFFHHPPYTKGSHNSDTETELIQMRQVIVPLLENAGVDLILAGHSHVYERSFLLDGHYGGTGAFAVTNKLDAGNGRENGTGAYQKPEGGLISHQGVVYAVVGSSGQNSPATNGLNHPAMYVSLNNLGSLVLDVAGNRLDAKFLRENGTTNDYFTILKVNYPPVASNLAANVNGDFSAALAMAGADINRNPITFVTNSPPLHGLVSGFNPVTGAFTYTPAHGYHGADSLTFKTYDGQTNSAAATIALSVIAPADGNANGIPDYWETMFGIVNPAADADADGATAAQEYMANTIPTNAASALRLVSIVSAGNRHSTFTWASVGGVRYRVQYRDGNLLGSFIDAVRPVTEEIESAPLGTSSTASFTDDFTLTGGPPANGARYYRVQAVQ